jgi:scyllo-inositol 2-dehydrogenase (NADP+)
MRPINVGLIGFGFSGRIFHAPFLKVNPRFELRRISDRTGKGEASGVYPNVLWATDWEEVINDTHIELVIIAMPNMVHYEIAAKALLAGKHVVVEKPFTVNSIEGEGLIRLSEDVKKVLSVYHNRRWDGDFTTVQRVLQSGCLGEMVEYESHYDRYQPNPNPQAWRQSSPYASGTLYDLGSHLIDQAVVLFGLPNTLNADLRTQRKGIKAIDYFDITLNYDRMRATLKSSMLAKQPRPRFLVNGTSGSYVKFGMDPQEQALLQGRSPSSPQWGEEEVSEWGRLHTSLHGLEFEGYIKTSSGNYGAYYSHLYDAIVNGVKPPVCPKEANETIKLIELVIESHKLQSLVPVT